jgi:hypothetical protein
MRRSLTIAAALLVATPALAGPPVKASPELSVIAKDVNEARLKAYLTKLVGFGTRHTLSDRTSDTRGIGAAGRWIQSEFEAMSKDCGGCLVTANPKYPYKSDRLPTETMVGSWVAIQKGTSDSNRVIVITGHMDSRVNDGLDGKTDAPGANDDGSGTVAVMEAARVLSKHKFPATIIYAADEGEEQGLNGAKTLVRWIKEQGWQVEANLNNDIVGNTHGQFGQVESRYIRVFSEGTKSVETPEQAAQRRLNGGELDSPSRNVARFMDKLAELHAKDLTNLDVMMVYRLDRYGRGGDSREFIENGFPAVRITEAAENYDRQHQLVRNENGRQYGDTLDWIDFPYLARVTRLNAIVAAALAKAPAPVTDLEIRRGQKGVEMNWKPAPGAVKYKVWWRASIEPQWTGSRETTETSIKLDGMIIDDAMFGVSSISADGWESPVEFPGPAGSFVSSSKPPPVFGRQVSAPAKQ